jgi:general secretion pathway protein D
MLVRRSHELLLAVTAAESAHQSRVIASPSIIATDSIPATMNVGQDVPVLTSSAVAPGGVTQGGNSIFTNTISNRSTGTSLNVLARINSSGVVTLIIDQDVSQATGNTTSTINSPEFSRRSFQTQVTVQDGQTIALGGFIQETKTNDSSGVPVLHRIPILGSAFGGRANSKARTELVIFLTPRVIYDTNQIQDASDEIKGRLKKLNKIIQNDPDK